MELKKFMSLVLFGVLIGVSCVSGRARRSHHGHNHHNGHLHAHHDQTLAENEEDDEDGRHAYLMRPIPKKEAAEDEDSTLTQAFEKHMKSDKNLSRAHDVYAYKLPSNLWFIVRYVRNQDGNLEKYMNIVDSFTSYLDKMDKEVKSVSVNVKGVETVFRLTTKPSSR